MWTMFVAALATQALPDVIEAHEIVEVEWLEVGKSGSGTTYSFKPSTLVFDRTNGVKATVWTRLDMSPDHKQGKIRQTEKVRFHCGRDSFDVVGGVAHFRNGKNEKILAVSNQIATPNTVYGDLMEAVCSWEKVGWE